VLVERRKLLDERIGSAMEASFAQSIDDHRANSLITTVAARTPKKRSSTWTENCSLEPCAPWV